jgi:beta-glucosidase
MFNKLKKITVVFLLLSGILNAESGPDYLNKNLPIEKRLDDLMQRMTLEEKVAQMCQYVGLEHQRRAARMRFGEDVAANDAHAFYKNLSPADIEKMVEKGMIGSFLHVLTAKEANELQRLAAKSRLKIPLLLGIDAIHGSGLVNGATVYPAPLTLASTWNPDLIMKIGAETALEMRAMGMHWAFTPNVDVARDDRWGRMGETFGEDPYMVSKMGAAMIKGLQEGNGDPQKDVIACAKHFVGGGQSVNGLNSAPTDVSRLTLYQTFFPPFQAAIDAGSYTIMAAHNEIEGHPCHGSRFLMTDILRKRMGFKGFIVSDWMDIERIYNLHHAAADLDDANRIAVEAGIDMHMHGPGFAESVTKLVKDGKLSVERINEAVRAILKAKFMLGLFEQPFVDESKAEKIVFNKTHRQTALQAARESIILLKNNGILPLNPHKKMKIFITGPNADNQTILGDWALRQPDENVITAVEGFRMTAGKEIDISYYDCGRNIWKMEEDKIETAAEKAEDADINIAVVGGNSLRYLSDRKTSGENTDRAHINLAGRQLELLEELYETGKPLIVVMVNGRPLAEPWIKEHAAAFIEAWEPGEFGGQALAEIVFGKVNPSGKLPVTIPRSEGQILMMYNHKPSAYFHKYFDEKVIPLYPFGFGLSYSRFEITETSIGAEKITLSDSLIITVKVKNAGDMAGKETVQLYLRDETSRLTRPVMELKRFKKIALQSGQEMTLRFVLSANDLGYYDENGDFIVEPGWFTLFIGNSSSDKNMKKHRFELMKS